jgi:hypothetical protein
LHFFRFPTSLALGDKKGLAVGSLFQENRPAWKGLILSVSSWVVLGVKHPLTISLNASAYSGLPMTLQIRMADPISLFPSIF